MISDKEHKNNSITDRELFITDSGDDIFTISMDEVEDILLHHSVGNGNVPHTPESTTMTLAGLLQKDYTMKRLFTPTIANAHRSGDIHIHNADMPTRLYSLQFSELVRVGNDIYPIGLLFDEQRDVVKHENAELATGFGGNFIHDVDGPVFVHRFIRHKADKPMVFISMRNGKSIICTEDHPFEIDGRMVSAGELTPETVLPVKKMELEDWMFKIMRRGGINLTHSVGKKLGKYMMDNEWLPEFQNHAKCLPSEFLKYNIDFLGGMICGIIEGKCNYDIGGVDDIDGTIISVTLDSHALACQLQCLFDVLNIPSSCTLNDNSTYQLSVRNVEKMLSLCEGRYEVLPGDECSKEDGEMFNDGRVASVMPHPTVDEYVYDFTTESHHFMVNGVRVHNCGGHSPAYVAKYGLSLPNLNAMAKPAKHADVLLEQMIKFAASMQGHFSGAIGFDAVNTFVAPYLVGLSDKEVRQCAQILVYEFAQQAVARGGQVIFSDLNLYWGVPKHYKDVMAIGPGGRETGLRYGDYENEARRFTKALMGVYNEGDGSGRPFFFPKPDCHITAENVDDDEYMNLLGSVASKMGSPYFVFDRGDDPSISQCCFDKGTKVLYNTDDIVHCKPFSEVEPGTKFKVFHNGSWAEAMKIAVSRNGKKMFRVRTANNKELLATEDHLFPTLRGDVPASELTTDDYVLFNTRVMESEHHYETSLTYEQGVLIGAFLGDGSYGDERGIYLSLNEEKYAVLRPIIESAYEQAADSTKELSLSIVNEPCTIHIGGSGIADFVRSWVIGTHSGDKALSLDALCGSSDFREGILFGWTAADGSNAHCTYTASESLVESMEILCASLGIQTEVELSDRRDEPIVVNGETFMGDYPLYCLRQLHPQDQGTESGVYTMKNNSVFFKLAEVEEVRDYDEEVVHCFEMENQDEPYFTMPSGWIVHNCRLKISLNENDVNELKTPWVSRFTALQNVTMNLPGMAYQSKGNDTTFMELLYKNMQIAKDAHVRKFDYIEKVLNMGEDGPLNMLNIDYDGYKYVRPEKMKFLIGMVGLNEAVQIMTGEQLHESKEAMRYGMKVIAQMNKNCGEIGKEVGIQTILEQTPAESTAYRFARLDKKRFGRSYNQYLRGTDDAPYYTNSSHLNIGADIDPIRRVKDEGKFHTLIDAGAMTHIWLGEHAPDPAGISSFVRKTFYNTTNSQIVFSPEFTTCVDCNSTHRGLIDVCPSCGSNKTEGITRIVGYFSKVQNWNKSKRQELVERSRVKL